MARRHLCLCTLVVQNVALVLLIKTSRPPGATQTYAVSVAVLMTELLKLTLSLGAEYGLFARAHAAHRALSAATLTGFTSHMGAEVLNASSLQLAVPGLLYCVQNNLLFVAISNLSVPVYQVTMQFKILTTALFSVLILGRRLSWQQVLSLFVLTASVAAVQLGASDEGNHVEVVGTGGESRESREPALEQNQMVGLSAIVVASLSSGFNGVWFEKVVKGGGRPVSIFIRNTQLAFFGGIIAVVIVAANDGARIAENGLFDGFSPLTWAVISMQAAGGLLVSFTIRFADNILKAFATSISIVLATAVAWAAFDTNVSASFGAGATAVVAAVGIFNSYPPEVVANKGFEQVRTQDDDDIETSSGSTTQRL